MIQLLNIKKGFNLGKANEFIAVNGVTLSLEPNRITVLKGPSGSGKTTLLSLIGCMARPTSGRIYLQGFSLALTGLPGTGDNSLLEVTSLPERFLTEIRRRTFGFIFQQFHLIKGISVLENVMLLRILWEKHGSVKGPWIFRPFQLCLANRASARVE
jgi:putative ABC transport system ATP-binding protein